MVLVAACGGPILGSFVGEVREEVVDRKGQSQEITPCLAARDLLCLCCECRERYFDLITLDANEQSMAWQCQLGLANFRPAALIHIERSHAKKAQKWLSKSRVYGNIVSETPRIPSSSPSRRKVL